MEMVAALFATALAGGEAVATTAIGTLGATAGTATALSTLQGVATAGSLLASAVGGVAAYGQSQMQARQADLASQEQAIRIKNDYLKKVGAARVAFSGSGIDISAGGQETGIEDYLKDQADFETNVTKNNAALQGEMADMKGVSSIIGAAGDIFKTGSNYGISIPRRGV